MACGQSCTSCTLTGAGCAQGEGCTVDKLCAPLSCSGAADGLACSLPSVLAGLLQTSPASYQYGPELLLTECCGGNCTDLDFDSSNCGACGGLCPVGTACQGGQCLQAIDCALAADATPCWLGPQAEGTCCGGACVDTSSAPANCGYCGQACQPGDACEAPYCLSNDGGAAYFPNEVLCSPGSDGENCALDGGLGVCCAGTCADPNAIENCAECGLGCLPCAAGCPGGTTCVNQGSRYDGSQLVQIETCLPTFCQPGESGGECAFGPSVLGPLQHFGAGNWAAGRLVDQIAGFCCDGACVDIAQDPQNCGACGATCSPGICSLTFGQFVACLVPEPSNDCLATCGSGEVCAQGVCVGSFCPSPLVTGGFCAAEDGKVGVCCPSDAPGSFGCSDLSVDPENCGGCGLVCPSGQTCSHGVCSGTPVNCGIGRIGGFCNLDAGPTWVCCSGIGCTDLAADDANCGSCGDRCDAGTVCVSGDCQ
jgi:hypothetical protein